MAIRLKKDKPKTAKNDECVKSRGGLGTVLWFLGLWLLMIALGIGMYVFAENHSLDGVVRVLTENDPKLHTQFQEQMLDYFDMTAAALIGDESKVFVEGTGEEDYIKDYPVVIITPQGRSAYQYGEAYEVAITDDAGLSFGMDSATSLISSIVSQVAEDSQDSQLQALNKREAILNAVTKQLDVEGVNLLYYAEGSDGTVLTNVDDWEEFEKDGRRDNYDYALYFNGENLTGEYANYNGNILKSDIIDSYSYQRTVEAYQKGSNYFTHFPELSQTKIVLLAAAELVEGYYDYSNLFAVKSKILHMRYRIFAAAVLGGLGLIVLALSFLWRKDRLRLEDSIVEWLGGVWVELKVLSLILALFFVVGISETMISMDYYQADVWLPPIVWLIMVWIVYVLLRDIKACGRSYFKTNMMNTYLNVIRSKEALLPFQEKLLNRFYTLIGTEIFLALVALVTFITVIIPLIAIGAGIYLLMRYIKQYKELVEDIGKITQQIERIKAGDMDTKLILSPAADLFPAAQALNSIQEGVITTTEERMRSERMKIDLVTNVSHDLKTPLTSIISYVDLLAQEDLPETAKDYVGILKQKSDRLKVLINDLFDLAKATSANLDVLPERIDFAKLLNQIDALMAEDIEHAGLYLKTNIPQKPVYIQSDGNKMHRVFENLLTNAMKYSLTGSRVYVDLRVEDEKAIATIKNTAKYEMNFDAESVLARFVRGDKARTTEGSGLGLAIAQSYTEACGGKLAVFIDGDLFKVTVTFDVLKEEPVLLEIVEEEASEPPAELVVIEEKRGLV